MISLNKRLETIASMVPKNSFPIDVGCDHAYLPIYLCQNKICSKVVASDIRLEPLKFATKNIQKYNLDSKIKTIQQDGINNLDSKIDTIIISGMGGISITNILSSKDNLKNIKYLIISPNNEFSLVRKKVQQLGFSLLQEKIVIDKDITYLIIRAIPGGQKHDNFLGVLDKNDLNTIYYFTKLLNTNTNNLKKIPKKYIFKRIRILKQNRKIKKFLERKI